METCEKCGRLECTCQGGHGPRSNAFPMGFGPETPWDDMPPKSTNAQPRLGTQPWNNTPNQPPLEIKVGQ